MYSRWNYSLSINGIEYVIPDSIPDFIIVKSWPETNLKKVLYLPIMNGRYNLRVEIKEFPINDKSLLHLYIEDPSTEREIVSRFGYGYVKIEAKDKVTQEMYKYTLTQI